MITENTAGISGGSYIQEKFMDIVEPKKQDSRSCEEITAEVVKRCGLVVKE